MNISIQGVSLAYVLCMYAGHSRFEFFPDKETKKQSTDQMSFTYLGKYHFKNLALH